MKGQASLELLMVFLALASVFSILLQQAGSVSEISRKAIESRNSQVITSRISTACERARITGIENLYFLSFSNMTVEACGQNYSLVKGANTITISPHA